MLKEIKEKYIQKQTGETITLNLIEWEIKIGKEIHDILDYERCDIIKLYEYNKEIFKEFIENIYIKYDCSIISFLINNEITLEDIKELTKIVLFPLNFKEILKSNKFILKDYEINIIDLFKYIYKQPYHMLNNNFLYRYFMYLNEQNKRKTLNKYNKFPNNFILNLKFIQNRKDEFVIKNDKKDIIKDVDDFHLEFYGTKCEYYITYKEKKYDLLNKYDRGKIYHIVDYVEKDEKIYLSEYYEYDYLSIIIASFGNLYYEREITENIYYLLKDDYRKLSKKELEEFQKMLLNINNKINFSKISFGIELFKKNQIYTKIYLSDNKLAEFDIRLLTSKFNENILTIYFLSNIGLLRKESRLFNKFKKKLIYDPKLITFFKFDYDFMCNLHKYHYIELKHEKLKIEPISLLDIIDYSNKGIYFEKNLNKFFYNPIFLCKDIKTEEEIILIFNENLEKIELLKEVNKKYSKDFIDKIKEIKEI